MKSISEIIDGFMNDYRDNLDDLELDRKEIMGQWINRFVLMRPVLTVLFIFLVSGFGYTQPLTASWYSVKSCLKEGTTGIMANGRKLDDQRYTAASWDYPFGTTLKVTNLQNKRSVVVEISDRGPARRLYARGRVLDLSVAAFEAIGDLKQGVIPIAIERVK